jgi:DNA-binding NtrC family response regulator
MTAKVTMGNEPVPVVWIIDPDQWPRAMLRAELIERGLDAVGYLRPADALAHLGARFPDLIVIDLRDATREAVAQLFQLGVPVIGVAAGKPEPEWLNAYKWGALLRRPISIGEIADRTVSFL